jgi:hypothetical protein
MRHTRHNAIRSSPVSFLCSVRESDAGHLSLDDERTPKRKNEREQDEEVEEVEEEEEEKRKNRKEEKEEDEDEEEMFMPSMFYISMCMHARLLLTLGQ